MENAFSYRKFTRIRNKIIKMIKITQIVTEMCRMKEMIKKKKDFDFLLEIVREMRLVTRKILNCSFTRYMQHFKFS